MKKRQKCPTFMLNTLLGTECDGVRNFHTSRESEHLFLSFSKDLFIDMAVLMNMRKINFDSKTPDVWIDAKRL